MNRWRLIARLAAHALAVVTIALCLLLPTSRYDWVSDVDPTVHPADLAGGGDDSAVVIGALAGLALLIEGLALGTGRTRRERILPAALLVATGVSWLARSAA